MLKRILITAACVLPLLVMIPNAGANEWRNRTGRFNEGASTWTYQEVRRTIAWATEKWSVPGGLSKAVSVADCESGLRATAVSPSGTYKGVYQQSKDYWPGRHRAAPSWLNLAPSVFNARSNIIVSILMARGGWSDWAGCA